MNLIPFIPYLSANPAPELEIGPGETLIVCRVSLAAGESCLVSVTARLGSFILT